MVDLSNFPSDVSPPINTPDLERDVQEGSLAMPTVGDFNAPLVSERESPPAAEPVVTPPPEAEAAPVSRAVDPAIRSAIEARPERREPPSEVNVLAQPPGFEERTDREARQFIIKQIQRREADLLTDAVTKRPVSDLIAFPNAPTMDDWEDRALFSKDLAAGLSEAEARIRQAFRLGDKRTFSSSDNGREVTVLEAQLAQSILDDMQTVRKKRIAKGITPDKDTLVALTDTQLINKAKEMATALGGEDPSLAAKIAAAYSGSAGLVRDLSGLVGIAAQSPVAGYRLIRAIYNENVDINKTLQREYTNFGEMFDAFAEATHLPKTTKAMQFFLEQAGVKADEDVASEILRQGRGSATVADRSAEFLLEGVGFLKLFKGVSIIRAFRQGAKLNKFVKSNSQSLLGRQVDNVGQVSPDEVMLIARSLAEKDIKKGVLSLIVRTFGKKSQAIKNFRTDRKTQRLFNISSRRVFVQQAKNKGLTTRQYRKELFGETRLEYKKAQTGLNKTERELAAAIKGNRSQGVIDRLRRKQLDQIEKVNIRYTQMWTLKNDLAPILSRENTELLLGELYISASLGLASSMKNVEGTILEPVLGIAGAISGDRIVRLGSTIARNTALSGTKATQNILAAFGVIAHKIPSQTLVRYILGKDVAFEGYMDAAGQFVRLSRSERNALKAIDENLNALSDEGREAVAEQAASFKELFEKMEKAGLDTTEFSEAASVIALVAPLRAVSNELTDKLALDLGSKSYLRDFVEIVENDLEVSKAIEKLNEYVTRIMPKIDINSVEGQELAAIFKGLQSFVKKQQTDIKVRAEKGNIIVERILQALRNGDEDPFRDSNMPDAPTEKLQKLYTEIKEKYAELSNQYPDIPTKVKEREAAKRGTLETETKIRGRSASERNLNAERSVNRLAILMFSRHSEIKSKFDIEYRNFFRGEGDISLDTDDLFELLGEINMADALRRGADISSLGRISSEEQLALFSRSTDLPPNLATLQRSFNTQAKEINNKTIEDIIKAQELDLTPTEVLNRVKKLLKDDGIKNPSDVEIYGKLISIGEARTVIVFERKVGPTGDVIRPAQDFISAPPVDQIKFSLENVHNIRVYARSQARKLSDKSGPALPEDRNKIAAFDRLASLADRGIQNGLSDKAYEAYQSLGNRYGREYVDRFYRFPKVAKAVFNSKPKKLTGPRLPGEDFEYKSAATSDNWKFLDLSKVKTQEDLDDLARNLETVFGEFDDAGNFIGVDPRYVDSLQVILQKMFYKGAVDQGFIRATDTIDIGDLPITELNKLEVTGTKVSLDDFEKYDSVRLSDKQVRGYLEFLDRTDQLFKRFGMTVDDAGLKTSLISLAQRNKSVDDLMDNVDADVNELAEQIIKADNIAEHELRFELENSIEAQLASIAGAQGNAARFIDILRTNLTLADETATGLNRMDDLVDNVYNSLNKESSLYKRLEGMTELRRRKEIKNVIANKVKEEALQVARGKVIGTGGQRGETPLSEIDPGELYKYLQDNEKLLTEVLEGKEHYKELLDFADFTAKVGPFAFDKIGLTIATRTPGGLAMESLLSRAYAVNRGVISLKYVAGEILIRKMRVQKLNALKAMMNNKETAEILSSIIRTGKLPAPKVQTKLNKLLINFIAREEVARRRNTRPSIDVFGGTLGTVDSIRTTVGKPIVDLFYPEDKDKPLPPLPGDNRLIRRPQIGTTQERPPITVGE